MFTEKPLNIAKFLPTYSRQDTPKKDGRSTTRHYCLILIECRIPRSPFRTNLDAASEMDQLHLLGYLAAAFIGLTLAILGGGGGILTVPILVFLFSVPSIQAAGYSLGIVGATGADRRGPGSAEERSDLASCDALLTDFDAGNLGCAQTDCACSSKGSILYFRARSLP